MRVALQALSAVLGGTQSLHTNSRDEALALPTEESVQIALRTQQVIAHESGVAHTVDPLAGSYYVERLTDEIEAEADRYIARIDEMGGMVQAIERRYPQGEIEQASYNYQQEIERGERIIVGVNRYQTEDDAQPDILSIGKEAAEAADSRGSRTCGGERDGNTVDRALDALEKGARGECESHAADFRRRAGSWRRSARSAIGCAACSENMRKARYRGAQMSKRSGTADARAEAD